MTVTQKCAWTAADRGFVGMCGGIPVSADESCAASSPHLSVPEKQWFPPPGAHAAWAWRLRLGRSWLVLHLLCSPATMTSGPLTAKMIRAERLGLVSFKSRDTPRNPQLWPQRLTTVKWAGWTRRAGLTRFSSGVNSLPEVRHSHDTAPLAGFDLRFFNNLTGIKYVTWMKLMITNYPWRNQEENGDFNHNSIKLDCLFKYQINWRFSIFFFFFKEWI